MPGPNSQPWAMRNGVKVDGKTALKRLGLRSGQGAYRDAGQAPSDSGGGRGAAAGPTLSPLRLG